MDLSRDKTKALKAVKNILDFSLDTINAEMPSTASRVPIEEPFFLKDISTSNSGKGNPRSRRQRGNSINEDEAVLDAV
jgi:hypothetical protein